MDKEDATHLLEISSSSSKSHKMVAQNLPANNEGRSNENLLEGVAAFHLTTVSGLIKRVSSKQISEIAQLLNTARLTPRTIYTMGNGGSASTALHLANDLSTTQCTDQGPSFRAICLNSNISLFSALANDFGYENVFARQLENLLIEDDVVIAISASGNSRNCINGLEYARKCGARTVGLLGFDGGVMKDLCDYVIHVPSHDYRVVEDVHVAVSHAFSVCLASTSL